MIQLAVPGIPRPQPRHRIPKRGGTYLKGPIKTWIKLLERHIPEATETLSGPVQLDLHFAMPRGKKVPEDAVWHLGPEDKDNLEKPVADALERKGYVYNDSQFCCGETRKFYPSDGMTTGVMITMTRAPESPWSEA